MIKIKIVLEYEGKQYQWSEEYGKEGDYTFADAQYMYEEGNFSCDCNKSLFISLYCDEKFKHVKCGDTIKLVSLEEVV